MSPLTIAGLVVVATFLTAWVIVNYFRSRPSPTDTMLIRVAVGPAVGLMGSAVLVLHLQSGDATVLIVCLTVVAIAELVVVVLIKQRPWEL